MSYISENLQKKRLQKYNININTKYIVGSKILERKSFFLIFSFPLDAYNNLTAPVVEW